jgi:2-polyprenyl-6-methoxyphenol hydroxylase-like FAD-dependent oxidoreductase
MRLGSATVVGGGIGGAVTALLLARAGVETTVIESRPDPRSAGAALALAANGLAVLDRLGLGDAVRDRGTILRGGVLRDERGRVLADVEPAVLDPGYDHLAVVPRSHLLDLLYDALEGAPSITLRTGVAVDASDVAGLAGELVVGADGLGSVVRSAVAFPAEVKALDTTYVRALLPVAMPDDVIGEWWTGIGLIGILPVGPGATYFYSSADAPPLREALDAADITKFRAAWSDAAPALASVLEGLTDFDDLLVNDVAEVHCARFVEGRTALLGDAAHAMAPNLGQGANSAMVDAVVLVTALHGADTLDRALAAYDERRRRPVQRVQANARRLLRWSSAHGRTVRVLRNSMLRATRRAMASPRVARATMQESPGWLAAGD